MTNVPKSGAWDVIPDKNLHYWYEFERELHFDPSTHSSDWPSIREPAPSVVFNLRDVMIGNNIDSHELDRLTLSGLQAAYSPDEWILALDWNHVNYHFWPHRLRDGDRWMVPVFPNGDYSIFVDRSFENGIFGHPWEKSFCVFGDRLLRQLEDPLRGLLSTLRENR